MAAMARAALNVNPGVTTSTARAATHAAAAVAARDGGPVALRPAVIHSASARRRRYNCL